MLLQPAFRLYVFNVMYVSINVETTHIVKNINQPLLSSFVQKNDRSSLKKKLEHNKMPGFAPN